MRVRAPVAKDQKKEWDSTFLEIEGIGCPSELCWQHFFVEKNLWSSTIDQIYNFKENQNYMR